MPRNNANMKIHISQNLCWCFIDKLSTHSDRNSYKIITTNDTILHTIWAPCWNYEDKHELQINLSIIKKPTIFLKKHGSYRVEHLFKINIVNEKLVSNFSIL